MRASKGFTLIELMIVVAIIGILSMFAMPAYQDYTARTRFVEILTLLQAQKISLVDEYTATGICIDRNIPASEIGSPYIDSMSTKGAAAGQISYVRINEQQYVAICTVVVNMSQKGKDYFKRGSKNASTFYLNMANADGSIVWGCAARTNFDRRVTSEYCNRSALVSGN